MKWGLSMRKFILGLVVGVCLTSSVVYTAMVAPAVVTDMRLCFGGRFDQRFYFDDPVLLYDGKAYAPVRRIVETLGANVHYDEDMKEVVIFRREWSGEAITDPKYEQYVKVGNLALIRDGARTLVSGDIWVGGECPASIGANLSFYREDDTQIGEVVISGDYPPGIHTFETSGEGDFTDYSKAVLYVGMYNGNLRQPPNWGVR